MLEVRGDLDLGQEPLAAQDGGELGVKQLDRHAPAMAQVLGEIDGGHPALAELALDPIAVGDGGCETRDGVGRWGLGQRSFMRTRRSEYGPGNSA